jgi:predicted RNA binding protein YcfA (HicA-like mRNA interferase family)
MRLAQLEIELRAAGFTFQRQRGSHRVYRDPAGRALTVTNHAGGRWGRSYCRAEITHIRRSLARASSTQQEAH